MIRQTNHETTSLPTDPNKLAARIAYPTLKFRRSRVGSCPVAALDSRFRWNECPREFNGNG